MIANNEANVILPPPSALNPIPTLSAALRLDNQEQLLQLLTTNPNAATTTNTNAATTSNTNATNSLFRQLLVFETDSLRTLLLRQVLSDPHTSTTTTSASKNSNSKKQSKKNWDSHLTFPFPKSLQPTIVGTRLLYSSNSNSSTSSSAHNNIQTTLDGAAEVSLLHNNPFNDNHIAEEEEAIITQHVDVITYFLRPWEVRHTQAVAARIRHWNQTHSNNTNNKKKKNASSSSSASASAPACHHRIVFLPQLTAVTSQILTDLGLHQHQQDQQQQDHHHHPVVSIHSLQLDLFPLESDVISMEYDTAILESSGIVHGMSSNVISPCARSLLKLQDIIGRIPRIQSIGGVLGEEVLKKLLNQTVDESLSLSLAAASNNDGTDAGNNNDNGNEDNNTMDDNDDDKPGPLPDNHLAMLLIDRQVDMVTPMTTPLTYEGLLDEVVGIDCGFIKVDVNTINPDDDDDDVNAKEAKKKQQQNASSSTSTTKHNLVMLGVHAGDSLYAEVRDQHVEKFGSFLQEQAMALKESHANFTDRGTKKDLTEIHQFVKQIPMFTQNLRSLTNHIHLAELIKKTTEDASFREQWQTERSMMEGEMCYDVLEEWISSGYPPFKFLRLLCLQSLCAGGLKSSRYDSLRAQVVQTYGYEFLILLHHLETLGWIRRKDNAFFGGGASDNRSGSNGRPNYSFANLRRSLILINPEVDTVEPDDVSFVSSGYAPLTVRLVQSAIQGWQNKQDVLKELPGRLLDIYQCQPPQDLASTLQQQTPPIRNGQSLGTYAKHQHQLQNNNSVTTVTTSTATKPILIVVFLGGITFMEIAALRFLSKRPTFPYHIIMVTTKIMNGSSMLQSLG